MAVDIFKLGSVELLVLFFLRESDAHGYQIKQKIEKVSNGILTVKSASLYPILYRLQESGCVTSKEEYIENVSARTGRNTARVRISYHIEEPGVRRLDELIDEHKRFVEGYRTILETYGGGEENG